jgi:hypothetical protein
MSEQNDRPAHKAIFPSKAEAEGAKPEGEHKMRVFEVFKGAESIGFTWANNVDSAICNLARHDGYGAKVADPKAGGALTAGRLANLSDEELAALGVKRVKSRKASE